MKWTENDGPGESTRLRDSIMQFWKTFVWGSVILPLYIFYPLPRVLKTLGSIPLTPPISARLTYLQVTVGMSVFNF